MSAFRNLLLPFLSLGLLALANARAADVRVVSQTVGTDELLLAVAEPSQVAALSHLSRDPVYSGVAEAASKYPQLALNADMESLLKHDPTLILCANYSRAELVTQARRMGIQVVVIDRYDTMADSYANLRLIARELGPRAEERAEAVIANCERRIAALKTRLAGARPVRVIAPSTYGLIPGAESTFQDLCEHAGAENLGATLGRLKGHAAPPSEQMLTWPIELLVVPGTDPVVALEPFRNLPPYQFMDAVRENRAALLKPYQLSCVSHLRIEGYEQLARQLHPERFK